MKECFIVNVDHSMPDTRYQVKLTDIFEGPMDLLVHLIRKNEVSIYDIPIALITDQYLEYIEWMKSMNIDVAGDFILMAATLIQIKSMTLLPIHPGDADDEDPRNRITKPLLEYLEIKSAAEQLAYRDLLGEKVFVRGFTKDEYLQDADEEIIQVGLFELINAFSRILENLSPDQTVDMTADVLSVKDRMTEIIDVLEDKGSVTFGNLFSPDADKSQVIVTFLAILEMVKMQLISVAQYVQSGIIRLFYL